VGGQQRGSVGEDSRRQSGPGGRGAGGGAGRRTPAAASPLLAQIKANTGRQAREVSVDAGYCSTANLQVLQRRHIRGYVAVVGTGTGSAPRRPLRAGSLLAAMGARIKRAGHRSRYRLRKITVDPGLGRSRRLASSGSSCCAA
jgi:hypothetical protein